MLISFFKVDEVINVCVLKFVDHIFQAHAQHVIH